ncbi:hypothetical protein H2198_004231 [Neophaeococcomyces mojaviensis]|uniref:Uncharacterized protein n=1 Tax=Neophaeococcomyces mojaviensis TaxID=3383035 RepID=A0ACC3A9I8_9EURO|nr:hypothetical protein H2198_004231 [Knufia sp. JES_112]
MAEIPKRQSMKRKVSTDSSSSEYEWVADETMSELILIRMCQGHWTADIPFDGNDDDDDKWSRRWLEQEEIWALQLTKDKRSARFLIVKPSPDHSKWFRIGQCHFQPDHDDERTIKEIGSWKVIDLY